MTRSVSPSAVAGRVVAPPSKSAMQRAVACAAMARGVSTIRNPSPCADSIAACRVAEALGASVERRDDRVVVRGGLSAAGRASPVVASCGESGLCLRMFSAIAALLPVDVELRAEGSLASRSVAMVADALEALGARCSTSGGLPPVRLRGPLRPGRVRVDGSASSQFVTGLVMALPMAGGESTVSVERLASGGYVELTMEVMRAFGAEAWRDGAEIRVAGTPYRAADYEVEGDWSGAAFMLVAGAVAGRGALEVVGLNPDSSQPDRAVVAALEAAGAVVRRVPGGYRVGGSDLRGFEFDATDCPDLFPPLVALASRCRGTTRLTGASRLRGKESDRAAALSEEFGGLGLDIRVDGDEMTVIGPGPTGPGGGRPLAGAVSSRGDHRIAMAAAVAALAGSGPVAIGGAECVSKSWPGFFDALDSIRA
ncbi:MAG TPA: 3-phosphoshikimate 1-carboxyvinyltransferase [Spirochaetia bacterium]|nr:3-phosphoshikimate 1-carboxyvinyltransferase [Spirochaetales bacterium]HRW24055.1 3-phosphoshikimate 1-carboxyvinyltransferase [Spirochaetia bacterium]